MRRLSPGHWLLILFGLLCLGVGLLAFYPQIPLSWYPRLHPMPSVEEVLVKPSAKQGGLIIWDDVKTFLCIGIDFDAILAVSGIETYPSNYVEVMSEWSRLNAHLNKTLQYLIDGRIGFLHLAVGLPISPSIDRTICTDVSSLAPGRYVAQFSFETPLGETYSYTWVFERTADGVIPEVTN